MSERFSRTELLIGKEALDKLGHMRVAVFGVGGVGGYVCEALVRSGIGAFDLVDNDMVSLSNLNRQIIATQKTIGCYKVDVMKERMLDINPDVQVNTWKCFFLPANADDFPFEEYDYIVDAVDTVTAKLELIMRAKKYNIPIISAMGAGNKLDPGRFQIADIYETKICPLARIMRRELKKRGVESLKVLYSDEPVITPINNPEPGKENGNPQKPGEPESRRRATPGSIAFVPAVAGLMIAGEIIHDMIGE